ncbi:MAG: aspartyl protease family protein [Planctomycetaceae bacterium]|nr:aspartyl protease family protein [Planctomycetaceae bacterium]
MGRVVVEALIQNAFDLDRVAAGELASDKVRTVDVSDALIDTGAMMLSLPRRLISALGLRPTCQRQARTAAGLATMQIYSSAQVTIQGRDVVAEVAELPDECPVLIGQIPLEGLDFVIDPVGQKLIGNPEHGGQHMIDMFWREFV